MLVVDVRDLDDPAVREPARGHVRDVLGVLGDLARHAALRVDEQEILRRVVEHAHHQQLRAVGRPATHDVPRGAGEQRALLPCAHVRDHDVHVRRLTRVGGERHLRAIWRGRVPREQSLHLARGIDRHGELRTIGLTDVELVQLGAPLVRRGEQLTARAPAEAAYRVLLDGHRPLGPAARGRERPRLVRAAALIRDDREPVAVGRERERRPACEAARGVRHARETFARHEVGERPGPVRDVNSAARASDRDPPRCARPCRRSSCS